MMMPNGDQPPSDFAPFISNLLARPLRVPDCDQPGKQSPKAAAAILPIASLLAPASPPTGNGAAVDPPPTRRQPLEANAIAEMRSWLVMNRLNPYPPRYLREIWGQRFGLTRRQIDTFLANTRQRVLRSTAARRMGTTIRAEMNGIPVKITFDR
jgi:hypothetical protein